MLFSASYASAYYETGNSFYYISRQLLFAIVGVIGMFVVANIDYHILHRFAFLIYIGYRLPAHPRALCPYPRGRAPVDPRSGLRPSSRPSSRSSRVVLIFAHLISTNYDRMKDPKYGVWPFLALMGIVVLLMLLEPHLSGTILILAIGIIMMFVGGTDLKWFMLGGGLLLAAAVVVIVLMPGVDPLRDEPHPALAATRGSTRRARASRPSSRSTRSARAGSWASGIGNSRQKHLYLPEPQNDFIFSVVCEELGFIGATLIILALRAARLARLCHRDALPRPVRLDAGGGPHHAGGRADDAKHRCGQQHHPQHGHQPAVLLLSGGTALVMLLAQMGVILSVSRQTSLEKE